VAATRKNRGRARSQCLNRRSGSSLALSRKTDHKPGKTVNRRDRSHEDFRSDCDWHATISPFSNAGAIAPTTLSVTCLQIEMRPKTTIQTVLPQKMWTPVRWVIDELSVLRTRVLPAFANVPSST